MKCGAAPTAVGGAAAGGVVGVVVGAVVVGAVVVGAAVVVVVAAAVTVKVPSVAEAASHVEITLAVPAVADAGTVRVTLKLPSFVVWVASDVLPWTSAMTCVLAMHVTVPDTCTAVPAEPDVGLIVTVPGTGADPAVPAHASGPRATTNAPTISRRRIATPGPWLSLHSVRLRKLPASSQPPRASMARARPPTTRTAATLGARRVGGEVAARLGLSVVLVPRLDLHNARVSPRTSATGIGQY